MSSDVQTYGEIARAQGGAHPSWCDGTDQATGEHSGACGDWGQVTPSNDPLQRDNPVLMAYPTWAANDGLKAGVSLWIHGDGVDLSPELTVDEAIQLAANIMKAVAAVIRG